MSYVRYNFLLKAKLQAEHSKPLLGLEYAVLVPGMATAFRNALIVGPVRYLRTGALHWYAKAFLVRRIPGTARCEAYWQDFEVGRFPAVSTSDRIFKGRVEFDVMHIEMEGKLGFVVMSISPSVRTADTRPRGCFIARKIVSENPQFCIKSPDRGGAGMTPSSFASELWRRIKVPEEL